MAAGFSGGPLGTVGSEVGVSVGFREESAGVSVAMEGVLDAGVAGVSEEQESNENTARTVIAATMVRLFR
ncbi:hypothetical protein CEP80_12620 [Jonesia denitrificans]|nr:hypothetical protein CEP80_12620 [Jonesia denitrificans]